MFPKLAPSEDRIRAEGIEPGQHANVVDLLADTQAGAERAARLFGVAAAFYGFSEMQLELLVDFVIDLAGAQDVIEPIPQ